MSYSSPLLRLSEHPVPSQRDLTARSAISYAYTRCVLSTLARVWAKEDQELQAAACLAVRMYGENNLQLT